MAKKIFLVEFRPQIFFLSSIFDLGRPKKKNFFWKKNFEKNFLVPGPEDPDPGSLGAFGPILVTFGEISPISGQLGADLRLNNSFPDP